MDVSSSGEKYLRISFREPVATKVTYLMFKNKKKSQGKSPDYLIYSIGKEAEKKEPEGMF